MSCQRCSKVGAKAAEPLYSGFPANSEPSRGSHAAEGVMAQLIDFAGKNVVITGCFSGMGNAAARMLIDSGARVHGLDYKPVDLPLAQYTAVDLRDPASIEAALAAVV